MALRSLFLFSANFHCPHWRPINPMSLLVKSAILAKSAIPFPLYIIRASMPINTSCIIAFCTKLTWRHPTYIPQRLQFIFIGSVMVVVRARIVRAVVPQEMHIAHLQFLNAFDFIGVILDYWVDPLAKTVPEDLRCLLWGLRGSGRERWGSRLKGGSQGCCSPRRRSRFYCSRVCG